MSSQSDSEQGRSLAHGKSIANDNTSNSAMLRSDVQ